jgi:RHS repeat-associated protein
LYGAEVDQILAHDRGNDNVSWQMSDQLGSVRLLVGNDGGIRNRYEYDAFGNVTSTLSGATDNSRYRYTGREWESEIDLSYYRARYYSPENGKFISQDPIGFGGGDGNLYRYVSNSPANAVDPYGNIKIEVVFNPLFDARIPSVHAELPSISFDKGIQGGKFEKYDTTVDHAFILVTDKNCPDAGEPYFYRGGPEKEFSVQDAGKFLNNDFGAITTMHGTYRSGTKDYKDPSIQKTLLVYNNPSEDFDTYDRRFQNALEIIKEDHIKYKWQGPNSNSVVTQVLQDVGLPTISTPAGVNVPGWGQNLKGSNLEKEPR